MSGPIVYVDRSQVAPGRLEELRQYIARMAGLVEQSEAQLLVYEVYFDEQQSQMTVIHVHRDSASLESHFKVVGPLFEQFTGLVELKAIDVYGRPDDDVLERVRAKAALLGEGSVTVHEHHVGFIRAGGPSA